MHWLFAPGFFTSEPVRVGLVVGTVVAVVAAVVGLFTVLRGQSFAGHSLADVATAGGSGAVLVGLSPLFGFVAGSVLGAGTMELVGVRRARDRDLATGVVLGAAIGLAALFLYLGATSSSTTGVSQEILFGSLFATTPQTVPVVAGLGAACLVLMAAIHRPLLLSSVSDEMAVARGVSVRTIGSLAMLALALAVGLSAIAIGAILSTALLIGPPATALRLTRRMWSATALASLIGVGAVWIGVLLAYDSFDWGTAPWPVSFFVVAVVFIAYLATELPMVRRWAGRRADLSSGGVRADAPGIGRPTGWR